MSKSRLGAVVRNASALLALCGAVLMVAAGCGKSSGGSSAPALWVPNEAGATIAGFGESQLASSGTPSQVTMNSSGNLSAPWSVAFDKSGDMWVSNFTGTNANTLAEYTPGQLASLQASPSPAANVVISGLIGPSGLAVDRSDNLWVAEWSNNELVEYTPGQLSVSGSPTPAIAITSTSLLNPSAIRFDAAGNLWVANTGANTVLKFTASQLSTSGARAPKLTLATTTIHADYGIAFDSSENLWVANLNSNTVQEFAASSLTSGKITPAASVTLRATSISTSTGTASSLNQPFGLAFEKSGALWVANFRGNSLAKFNPKQLGATGAPVPAVYIGTALNSLVGPALITFGP